MGLLGDDMGRRSGGSSAGSSASARVSFSLSISSIYISLIYCLLVITYVPKTNNETRVVSALTSRTSLGNKVHREKTN